MRSIRSVLASVRLILTSVNTSPFGTTAWGVALSGTFLVYDRIIAGDLLAGIRPGARAPASQLNRVRHVFSSA